MSKKYQVIYDILKKDILSGVYNDGDKLPSESELMKRFQVSRQTIRQALDMLKSDNLICKSRGSGSYIHIVPKQLNTKRIVVIAYSITESIFPFVLSGIEAVLSDNGYVTMLYANNNDVMRERQILTKLCEDPVDGVILCAVESVLGCANLDLVQQLRKMGTQFLFLGIRYPDKELEDIPSVTMDDYKGVYSIVTEAIGTEHHCIGGIFFPTATHLLQRISAARQAIIDAGLHYNSIYFQYFTSTENLNEQIQAAAIAALYECELIICSSGITASPLIEAIHSIPNSKVKTVLIFDETEYPPCDKVNVIMYKGADVEYGKECAAKLLRMINGLEEYSISFPWIKI